MTYLEIIEWIQGNILSIHTDEGIGVRFEHKEYRMQWWTGKDLISIVLSINKKELIN